jgi:GH43 family beta-xylosidase
MNSFSTVFKLLFVPVLLFTSCSNHKSGVDNHDEDTYTNPLIPAGSEPWAIFHKGKYYYTQGCEDKIVLWQTTDITDLKNAESREVWIPKEKANASHLWSPEIHFIKDRWYVYFAADDGNTDNHQIYVIENSSVNPFDGQFVMKGRIQTDKNNNWAIHANVFEHKDELYMIWSGWQKRRIEAETQCIYIAKMENPWTLKSERILLSKPEFEWERQWINPDGSRTAYPIYVNESPQAFHSKNKDKVLIYYSASGTWTPYYAIGLLTASASSNLLDPASWTKSQNPVFMQSPENDVFAPGSISFIPSPDSSETYLLYYARQVTNNPPMGIDSRSPRMQKIDWDENGVPVLGVPVGKLEKLKKPSGTN